MASTLNRLRITGRSPVGWCWSDSGNPACKEFTPVALQPGGFEPGLPGLRCHFGPAYGLAASAVTAK